MCNLKIGIQTLSLRQPLKQALHTAARLGADGVEIDLRHELPGSELSRTGVRQLRKLFDDLGLRMSAIAFPTRRGYDDPQDLERRILATRQAMKQASDLGARVIVNRVGNVPDDPSDERFRRLVESLTLLAAGGERFGVRLAAQTGAESGPQLARLIESLPAESMGVALDPGALIFGGHSPSEAAAALGRGVLYVHATDAVRDFAMGRAVEVALGRGTADFPALLGQLEEFAYRGWVTIKRHDAADPLTEIADAVAYLRSL